MNTPRLGKPVDFIARAEAPRTDRQSRRAISETRASILSALAKAKRSDDPARHQRPGAAARRIAILFDRFQPVAVCYSGGKDSQVVSELAYVEARRRGRSITYAYADLEFECESAFAAVTEAMGRPGVTPLWH